MPLSTSAIQNAYNTVFGRSASDAELQLYANASYSTSAELQNALYLEPEYATTTMPIARLYATILGRDPDAGGLNFYLDHVREGTMTRLDVAHAMINSPEARSLFNYGSSSNEAFVRAMYQATLGREGEEQGVDYYVARLESGILDRAGVAMSFAESAEMVARVGIRAFPAMDGASGGALVVPGLESQAMYGFASGINVLDLGLAGTADNYVEMNVSGLTNVQSAVDASAGMFTNGVNYVFMYDTSAGAGHSGFLVGDTNFDGQADISVTLVGLNSADFLDHSDIV